MDDHIIALQEPPTIDRDAEGSEILVWNNLVDIFESVCGENLELDRPGLQNRLNQLIRLPFEETIRHFTCVLKTYKFQTHLQRIYLNSLNFRECGDLSACAHFGTDRTPFERIAAQTFVLLEMLLVDSVTCPLENWPLSFQSQGFNR